MVRVHVPGLSGLTLRVSVTTNGACWHQGIVDTTSRSIELGKGEVIPASQVRRLRHMGAGTWVDPLEGRAILLLLAAIGGMDPTQLHALAWESAGLAGPWSLRGRPLQPREVAAGLAPSSVLPNGRLILEEDPDALLVGE